MRFAGDIQKFRQMKEIRLRQIFMAFLLLRVLTMLFADFVVGRTVGDERSFGDDGGGRRGKAETAVVGSKLQQKREPRMGGNGLQLIAKIRNTTKIRL